MAFRIAFLMIVALGASSCSETHAREQEALAAFTDFQDALFAGDHGAVRRLVCEESRAAVDEMDFGRLGDKQRLRVLGARGAGSQVLVDVEDPNEDNRRTCFVLVREYGALRVDLVATTAFNRVEHPREDTGPTLEPRRLEPWEIERIRAMNPDAFR